MTKAKLNDIQNALDGDHYGNLGSHDFEECVREIRELYELLSEWAQDDISQEEALIVMDGMLAKLKEWSG